METNDTTHFISLQKTYDEGIEAIFNLFMDGTVFKLTGADHIQSDFKAGGLFRLMFNNRGAIHGQFIKINKTHIIIEWNADGFQRHSEIKTLVEITLSGGNGKCILTLDHKNIKQEDSASAKKRAWTEILDNIEKTISNNR